MIKYKEKIISKKLGILLILIQMMSLDIMACSCNPISFKKAIQTSDEILTGELIKAEKHKKENGTTWVWRYQFEVKEKWKGSKSKKIIVEQEGSSCDFVFDIYKPSYLIYGTEESKSLKLGERLKFWKTPIPVITTWLCSRTIDEYSSIAEHNWYDADKKKLNELYVSKIELEEVEIRLTLIISVVIGALIMLTIGLRLKF